MGHQHQTGHARSLDRRLWISAVLNLGITLVEFAGGLWAGSLALLADAAHNLADVGALGLAIIARSLGRRPPTVRHTYGLKRAEVIAALINAAVLIAISALLAREAVSRFLHPEPVVASVMVVAAAFALVGNVISVLLLHSHRAEDINVRSAFLHLAQDALASLLVLVAALFARTAAGPYLDPIAAVLIAVVVLRSAVLIVMESLNTLLEGTPAGLHVEDVVRVVSEQVPEVQLHHVHIWELGPGQLALTAHMKVGTMSLAGAESVTARVRKVLEREWGVTHVTLEAETAGCGHEGVLGDWPREE